MLTTLIILLILGKLQQPKIKLRPERPAEAYAYCQQNGLNTRLCILVDYGIHSGLDRLFVWDFDKQQVVFACPVAHGKGHGQDKKTPSFSNDPNSWLSSLGKCRIAERYKGRFGIAYRLDGLEESNSNVRKRCIVLHQFWTVPPYPIHPLYSGRSKGCVMVAKKSMNQLDELLGGEKDVLLYTYCDNCDND